MEFYKYMKLGKKDSHVERGMYLHAQPAYFMNVKSCNSESQRTLTMLKQLMIGLTLTAGLMLFAPVSEADAGWGSWWSNWWSQRSEKIEKYKASKASTGSTSSRSVPELDPGAAGGAIVLIVGGVAYIVSRRREEEDLA